MLILLCCLSAGCGSNGHSRLQEASLCTTDERRLYFHNVRSIRYQILEVGKDRMQLCRHKDFVKQQPAFFPVIANNWMHDEAYIIHELHDSLTDMSPRLLIRSGNTSDTFDLNRRNYLYQLELARRLYQVLQAEDTQLKLCFDDSCQVFLLNESLKKTFRLVYRDYLKLVGAIR